MKSKTTASEAQSTDQSQPTTLTLNLGKRQFNRLVEIAKPFGMSPSEAAEFILSKHLAKE